MKLWHDVDLFLVSPINCKGIKRLMPTFLVAVLLARHEEQQWNVREQPASEQGVGGEQRAWNLLGWRHPVRSRCRGKFAYARLTLTSSVLPRLSTLTFLVQHPLCHFHFVSRTHTLERPNFWAEFSVENWGSAEQCPTFNTNSCVQPPNQNSSLTSNSYNLEIQITFTSTLLNLL